MQWDFGGFPWWLGSSQVRSKRTPVASKTFTPPNTECQASTCDTLVLSRAAQVVGGGQDKKTQMRIRTDDPNYLMHVDRWWNTLLPRLAHLTYQRGELPYPE